MKDGKVHNMRLIITGGGTGGHLFPGISLAQAMMQTYPGCEVLFIGTERKVDKTALADLGFVAMTGIPLPGWLILVLTILFSMFYFFPNSIPGSRLFRVKLSTSPRFTDRQKSP